MKFDPDEFVAECRHAATETDTVRAIIEVVERAIAHGDSIDEALGRDVTGRPDTFFSSPDLTVQRILWPGGSESAPHDHRMWAVVGVYAGHETNVLYRRDDARLARRETVEVDAGEVISLAEDAVHAVANPDRTWTAGLHVYGGGILDVPRSAWTPAGREVPFEQDASERRSMVQAMRDLAEIRGRRITEEDRFAALSGLWEEARRRRRNLSPAESRVVVMGAWNLDSA